MTKKELKLQRNKEAKIRYQLLRDAGYSVKEAQARRYSKSDLDISGIQVSKAGKVRKGRHYHEVRRVVDLTERINVIRAIENPSTFTKHGYLTNKPKDPSKDTPAYKHARQEYYDMAMAIKKRDKLSNDQAWYFLNFMLQNNYTYEKTRRELLGSEQFEMYRKSKKGRR